MTVDPLIAGAVAHVLAEHNAVGGTVQEEVTRQLVKAHQRTATAPTVVEATAAAVASFNATVAPRTILADGTVAPVAAGGGK